ncbi:hypothetical protein DSLPV1_204 [Dishui lake phycodnavirus 1]|uniref:hypothetical protein n=1 Tax=Dishui lake phycodnavirus 1 TaxID=2079134 RepID=UPI000CD68C03|nr:hypothetical protein C5Y57_gp194 [Dishui lake phycodnavirus 1]AUT19175.1 hypothetical protein DSLPV1_204 [Dishui lake phycodnavirus 1]
MVQSFSLTTEEKKEKRRNTCIKPGLLREALGKCADGSTQCFIFDHKLMDTKETDFLPTGLCKTGPTGVLLLESERTDYENNYCDIDPESTFCKSRTPPPSSSSSSSSGPAQNAKIQGVPTETAKSSNNGGTVVISFMSSSSVFLSCIAAMMMSGKLF